MAGSDSQPDDEPQNNQEPQPVPKTRGGSSQRGGVRGRQNVKKPAGEPWTKRTTIPWTPGTSDLLSDLPLEIRTQILSCIPSLTAVQTFALSSDWKESWMKCFRIYLEDKPPCDDNEHLASFGNQLMRSLQLVGGPSEKLCATFRLPRQVPLFEWVGMALSRHIHELVLEVDELQLPASFFSCTSLVKLRLRVHKFICEWQKDCLLHRYAPVLKPLLNLTSLEFLGVNRRGLKSVFYVLDSCPALKHLSFGKLGDSDWGRGSIPRFLIECLRTLEVKDHHDLSDGPDKEALDCVMENARRLKTLRVSYNRAELDTKLHIESYKTDVGLGDEGA
ncbi:F-box/LRR-repeat protein At3g26922-like [Bidens hawaiensis]|uniref:F-box/LRR-repeat protein At3g26922-like n=1 Tax=Bidens hawaiensis TaxID=980011 RepID=UPI00404A3C87